MLSIGIDLAGLEKNATGLCTIFHKDSTEYNIENIERVVVEDIFLSNDIISRVKDINPDIIAIDAPFSVPDNIWRLSETHLISRGFHPISPTLENMKVLARRAVFLNQQLSEYKRIETFPRAVEALLKTDKITLIDSVRDRLEKKGKWERGKISKDQYDAILCALCGLLHLNNKTEILGNNENFYDQIIIPKIG